MRYIFHPADALTSGQRLLVSSLFLGGILESALHEGRNVILVVIASGGNTLTDLTDEVLESLILLGTDLLDDVGEHILKLLGFTGTRADEKILTNGVLNYNFKG